MNDDIEVLEVDIKPKKKKSRKKILIGIFVCFVMVIASFVFLLYGPYSNFRNWLITTAMTTMNHQYLATTFYSDKTIDKVLSQNYVKESGDGTDTTLISMVNYSSGSTMFLNKYDKEILTKDNDNDVYKLIKINGDGLRGYLVAIYDASFVKVATASTMGKKGQMLVNMAKENNALVAMNASGFVDPNYMSNGATPHGAVIKNGQLVSNKPRLSVGGGIIGFTNDNKLILSHMSGEEAINAGVRDAVDFGPFLIVNGVPSFIKGNGGWGSAPRSAIAQRKDGIVLFLVMDGRDYTNGVSGADMTDMTEILMKYGAYNAANLDGGTSSGLVINNELINKPVNGSGEKRTREIPDAWIVTK